MNILGLFETSNLNEGHMTNFFCDYSFEIIKELVETKRERKKEKRKEEKREKEMVIQKKSISRHS